MGVRAVLAEMTLFFLLKVLAYLRLVVVIRYVEHFVLHFDRKLLNQKEQRLIALFIEFWTPKFMNTKVASSCAPLGAQGRQPAATEAVLCYESRGRLSCVA